MNVAACKLAIRSNEKEIVAYVSDMQEKEMIPIATFSLALARKDKAVFNAWVDGMQGVMAAICKSATGKDVVEFFRFTLGDKQ